MALLTRPLMPPGKTPVRLGRILAPIELNAWNAPPLILLSAFEISPPAPPAKLLIAPPITLLMLPPAAFSAALTMFPPPLITVDIKPVIGLAPTAFVTASRILFIPSAPPAAADAIAIKPAGDKPAAAQPAPPKLVPPLFVPSTAPLPFGGVRLDVGTPLVSNPAPLARPAPPAY